ncbi:9586_t:CDS:2, partial [Paraglomus brasilianum]
FVERLKSWSNHPEVPKWYKSYVEKRLATQIKYPVDSRTTDRIEFEELTHPRSTTKQATKGNLGDNLALHKCALAYASDDNFLLTAIRPHALTPFTQMMMASLCHSVWFHDPNTRADEWLLCEMESPQSANGRGLVFGRIFTRDGRLVASTAQEGVIRVIQEEMTPKANF